MVGKVAEVSDGYFYEITEGSCDAEECEGVVVYGIVLTINGERIAQIDDISSMRTVVEKLLELCDRNEVVPENFAEVIEDYLE